MDVSLLKLTGATQGTMAALGAGFAAYQGTLVRQWSHAGEHYLVVGNVPDTSTAEQIASDAGLSLETYSRIEFMEPVSGSTGAAFEVATDPRFTFGGTAAEPVGLTLFCPRCGGWEEHGPPCV